MIHYVVHAFVLCQCVLIVFVLRTYESYCGCYLGMYMLATYSNYVPIATATATVLLEFNITHTCGCFVGVTVTTIK